MSKNNGISKYERGTKTFSFKNSSRRFNVTYLQIKNKKKNTHRNIEIPAARLFRADVNRYSNEANANDNRMEGIRAETTRASRLLTTLLSLVIR